MTEKVIPFAFDRDALWKKVRDRKSIFLDMNCWIFMRDDRTSDATRIKEMLRKAVDQGRAFCPLSYGVLTELYKQSFDSRMRTGQLMEDLSLNVVYANKGEIFTWELERFVSRQLGVGPVDLSSSGLYVPPILYMSSALKIGYPQELDSEEMRKKVGGLRQELESLTVTNLIEMSYRDGEDWGGKFVKGLPDPPLAEIVEKIRVQTKGNKHKMLLFESQAAFEIELLPMLAKSTTEVQRKFKEYILECRDRNRRANGTHIGVQSGPTRVQEFTIATDRFRSRRELALVPRLRFRYPPAAG